MLHIHSKYGGKAPQEQAVYSNSGPALATARASAVHVGTKLLLSGLRSLHPSPQLSPALDAT
jgi:hypothetical protein